LDLTDVFSDPDPSGAKPRRRMVPKNGRPRDAFPLDQEVYTAGVQHLSQDLEMPLQRSWAIHNRDRSVGARLAGHIARTTAGKGLAPDGLQLGFQGIAGQSFGAFCTTGMSLTLHGVAQDYVGKGMGGGKIVVTPQGGPKDQVAVGNTVLYGATGGSLFVAGQAGERFAVRNSGATGVVEGCGDHGCEYMTRGVVVILGRTGRNFGAGMSGGEAFVFDEDGAFEKNLNPEMVATLPVGAGSEEEKRLRDIVETHLAHTQSVIAADLLARWSEALSHFKRVGPKGPPISPKPVQG
jgi:glutamate synthase domain-containing protein 3